MRAFKSGATSSRRTDLGKAEDSLTIPEAGDETRTHPEAAAGMH